VQLAYTAASWNVDILPDGKRAVAILNRSATSGEQRSLHVTFLLNFFDEIRRRIPPAR
jgi:hypothetical protein